MTTARSSRFMDTPAIACGPNTPTDTGGSACSSICEALEFAFQHEFRDGGIALAGDVRYQSESPLHNSPIDKAE